MYIFDESSNTQTMTHQWLIILYFSFVGELYLEKLLSVNIMIGCMRQLINSEHETELESLSKLIPTIGKELENEQRGQEVNIMGDHQNGVDCNTF